MIARGPKKAVVELEVASTLFVSVVLDALHVDASVEVADGASFGGHARPSVHGDGGVRGAAVGHGDVHELDGGALGHVDSGFPDCGDAV